MMMMSFAALCSVSIIWVLWGYSMAFGSSVGGLGLVGSPTQYFGLAGLMSPDAVAGTVPALAYVAFQSVFAVIAVALISGAIADRAKFLTWVVFTVVWATLVYFPVAHWVFAFDGFAAEKGGWIANNIKAIDFAGGTAIHINAGAAGLALALVLGKRIGWPREAMRPHNLTLVMIGAGLLWFGWFGFNSGSAVSAGTTASVAWVNTFGATGAAMAGWLLTERVRDGHATSLGAASGIVAGLVAITPSCSSVSPVGALVVGLLAGVACAYAVGLKFRFGFDDSLDVVGVHLVGGLVGTLAIGFLATAEAPAKVDGLFYGGGLEQLKAQAIGAFSVLAYSFIVTWLIGKALHALMGFRITSDAEISGIDLQEHAETGYDLTPTSAGHFGGAFAQAGVSSSSSTSEAVTEGARS